MIEPVPEKVAPGQTNWLERLSFLIATLFGAGLFPVGPGTAGTFVSAVVFHFWFPASHGLAAAGVTLSIAVAMVSIPAAMNTFGRHDPSEIVIDEWIGLAICWWIAAPGNVMAELGCFVAFRFFDILKPPPIGFLDRKVKGALGVIADDAVAGIFAGLVVLAGRTMFPQLGFGQ